MRTKVTKEWLRDHQPCSDELAYWVEQDKPDLSDFVRQCIKDDHCEWASWLMVRCMDRKQYLRYALYAVKQVEPIHRKKYPNSTVVTDSIKAVQACIRDDSAENREAAASIISYDATYSTYASDAVVAAAYASNSVVNASNSAINSAYAVAYAAARDADYDSPSGKGAYNDMFIKLLRYGIRSMKEKQK